MEGSDVGADGNEDGPCDGGSVVVDGTDDGIDVTSVVVTNDEGSVGESDTYTEPVDAVVVEYGTLVVVTAELAVTPVEPFDEPEPPELLVPFSVLGKHTVRVDSSPVSAVVDAGQFEEDDIVVHSESAIGVDSNGVLDVGSSVAVDGSDENGSDGSAGSEGKVDPVASVLIEIRDAKDHSAESTVIRDG